MKLVESDVPDRPTGEHPAPPPPPHRRVAVSLVFTLSVLIGTVAVIYTVFPKRNNEVLDIAIEQHRHPDTFELVEPSRGEIVAWSVGLYGRAIPWPKVTEGVHLEGAYAMRVFRRPAALVRLSVDGQPVTLMAMKARDWPPRHRENHDDELIAKSWRSGKWLFVAVGREDLEARWQPVVGAR